VAPSRRAGRDRRPPVSLPALVLLFVALGFACADWLAVARDNKRLEYVFKPATMLVLVGAALVLRPVSDAQRSWFVAALLLGLVGDVFLMLPRDLFLAGLGAFLLGHLAFIAGFLSTGFSAARAALAMTFLLIVGAVLVQRVLTRMRARGMAAMAPAVAAYAVVISLMVAVALASRQPLAVVPALLFYASDTMISFRRFVSPRPWMPVAIIVTYHLAQVGLVLALAL
jgi:uncharacterized membrane protein YhhN